MNNLKRELIQLFGLKHDGQSAVAYFCLLDIVAHVPRSEIKT